ncbi:hemerythrin domain-containing protein [Phycicoccus sp. Soil748]|uniref:hemerythrin domain-containing protein n=1 Tax=Phycicoccus sp. Soil748 TaxID=1736397 RepID=UPI0009EC76CB|nr:hemerythrin domain-containing protein [Phycicoccus sp. Soil748]
MCEYCGCQDIAAIAELTREHDAVVAEIAHVRVAVREGDVDGAAVVARRISAILRPHTAVEEHGLFPHLAHDFPGHIAVLQREHSEIETVLAEAASPTSPGPGWLPRLLEAMERLRDHILKEQDGLFPASLSVLDESGWASVEAARALAGSGLSAARTEASDRHGHAHDRPHDQPHDHPHDHPHDPVLTRRAGGAVL